jgi:hypothetical protein
MLRALFVLLLTLFLVPLMGGCAQHLKKVQANQPGPATIPVRVVTIEVQEGKAVRKLESGEPIQAGQDFALQLDLLEPLYLYVVLEHADQSQAPLIPSAGQSVAVTRAGAVRVPQHGETFIVDKLQAVDKLCLVASGSTLAPSQISCSMPTRAEGQSRGEDQPPPPSKERKAKKPPPPPPADPDRSREGGRWVILLPLATP